MIRYNVQPGTLVISEDGDLVSFKDAQRDIERLGNELVTLRGQYKALEAQRIKDIAIKDEQIEAGRDRIERAARELGYERDEY